MRAPRWATWLLRQVVPAHRDRESPSGDTTLAGLETRFRTLAVELRRRLEADPTVTGVTFAQALPRTGHGRSTIELDGPIDASANGALRVVSTKVGVEYFDALGASVLAGRAFNSGDLSDDATDQLFLS